MADQTAIISGLCVDLAFVVEQLKVASRSRHDPHRHRAHQMIHELIDYGDAETVVLVLVAVLADLTRDDPAALYQHALCLDGDSLVEGHLNADS